jgi:hypothetical protein
MALGVAMGLAAIGWSQPAITKITVAKQGDGAIVRVSGKDLSAPTLECVQGHRVWIASFVAGMDEAPRYVRLRTKLVRYVQTARFQEKPPVARVLAWCTPGLRPKATRDGNGDWLISFGAKAHLTPAPSKPAHAKPAVRPTPVKPAVQAPQAKPMAGVKRSDRAIEESSRAAVRPIRLAKAAVRKSPLVTLEFTHTDVVHVLKAPAAPLL